VTHSCLTCRPGPDSVIDYDTQIIQLPQRFRGPPASGNGGIATGLIACLGEKLLGEPIQRISSRLLRAVPLASPMTFTSQITEPNTVSISIGDSDGPAFTGWASKDSSTPIMSNETVALLASNAVLTKEKLDRFENHVEQLNPSSADFAGCFVCGPKAEFGLRLRPRPVTDEISWLSWNPGERWTDDNRLALLPAIASLDCTAAIGFHREGHLTQDESALLGSFDATIIEKPPTRPAGNLRIVARTRSRDRRKIFTDIGLFSPTGQPYVLGLATWIVVTPEKARGK